MLHHYRNNPSVVMWCVGNEVPEQGNGDMGPKRNRFLQDICHREDPTRPVTNGMDNPNAVTGNNFAALLDVAGSTIALIYTMRITRNYPSRLYLAAKLHPR